jgi:YHS domain-containing protein
MDNPAGLFQVEKLLGRKLVLSGLERYISLRACVIPEADQTNQSFHCLVLRQGRFQPETLPPQPDEPWPVDPVCGMDVAPGQAAGSILYHGIRYHFCSEACLSRFRDDPSHYVQGDAS